MSTADVDLVRYGHRRTAHLVGLGFLGFYSVFDVFRAAGPAAYAARATWIAAIAISALSQSPKHPRTATALARCVGIVSGACATVLVAAHGGSAGLYFGFLLCVPFCVLVLVPDLPSSAALAGVTTTIGGIVLLVREGRPLASVIEWTVLVATLNILAGWSTQLYHRFRRAERDALQGCARAMSDLRVSEERFQAAFSSMSLGAVVVTMPEARILAANAALCEKLGYADLVGRSYYELLAPGEAEQARALCGAICRGAHGPRVERRFVTSSGEVMLASVHAAPVHDATGAPSTAIVVVEDITERRLLRERLAKSERLAALGTLAAGVAHEINNPLAYVKANLCWIREAIAQGELDGELSRVVAETERGAERIARIVAELSAYARAREEPRPTDVRRIVDETLRMISQRVESACELVVQVAPDLPPVSAVGRHLSQALTNLVVNAVEAIESRVARDGTAPRCVVVRALRDGRCVAVSVEDSGEGLGEEVRAHLFEPFFTTKGPLGTGLGLAISRENLSRFGATIEVGRSGLGGARFTVRLPCAAVDLVALRRTLSAA